MKFELKRSSSLLFDVKKSSTGIYFKFMAVGKVITSAIKNQWIPKYTHTLYNIKDLISER